MASYSDDFNRADGNLGADWVQGTPDATQVVSNRATLGFQNPCIWSTPVDTDDMFVEVTQVNLPSSSWGPIICASTTTPGGSDGYRLDTQDWQWSIALMRDGVEVARSDESDFHYSELPGPFVWRLEIVGSDVRVFMGGVEIIVWSDPSRLTGRHVGFACGDPSALMDDWSGGDYSTGPAPIDGTIDATTDDAVSTISGTVTAPSFTGTIDAATGAATSSIAGTAVPPSFTGTIAASTDPATSTIDGTVLPPPVTGTLTATTGEAVGVFEGTADGPGAITGTITADTGAATMSGAGTVTPPAVTGTITASSGAATATFTGTVLNPGSVVVVVSFGPATVSGSAVGDVSIGRTLAAGTASSSTLGPVEVSP